MEIKRVQILSLDGETIIYEIATPRDAEYVRVAKNDNDNTVSLIIFGYKDFSSNLEKYTKKLYLGKFQCKIFDEADLEKQFGPIYFGRYLVKEDLEYLAFITKINYDEWITGV